MIRLVCTCELYGERFSPKLIAQLTGITFARQNEVGDIGTSGRYRGTRIPYGSATIGVPKHIEAGGEILWLARRLMPHIQMLRDAGASDIWFSIGLFHDGQCNWSLSEEELSAVSALGIRMDISAHEDDGTKL